MTNIVGAALGQGIDPRARDSGMAAGPEKIVMINIASLTEEAGTLWAKALELAELFGDAEEWTLIGGLMVQLHALEHDLETRLTSDIDLLGDSRRRPAMTQRIAEVLTSRGARMSEPPTSDRTLGYRFELDGEIVEVLGTEGIRGADPKTIGKFRTFQVPGGTQALRRSEVVGVSLGRGAAVSMRRPNLLGAILIKARVVAKRRREKFDSDRQDLIVLLSLVEDPRALAEAEELKKTERRWLSDVESKLQFDDPSLTELFDGQRLQRASQAYRLLIA